MTFPESLTRNRRAANTLPWLRWLVLAFGAVAVLYPMGLFLINSLKSNAEFVVAPLAWPTHWAFENYAEAWNKANMGRLIGKRGRDIPARAPVPHFQA